MMENMVFRCRWCGMRCTVRTPADPLERFYCPNCGEKMDLEGMLGRKLKNETAD